VSLSGLGDKVAPGLTPSRGVLPPLPLPPNRSLTLDEIELSDGLLAIVIGWATNGNLSFSRLLPLMLPPSLPPSLSLLFPLLELLECTDNAARSGTNVQSPIPAAAAVAVAVLLGPAPFAFLVNAPSSSPSNASNNLRPSASTSEISRRIACAVSNAESSAPSVPSRPNGCRTSGI
jgi:hypothetical protein